MMRPAFIKDVLVKWNIQFYVMASLVFQMILVFLAPMRRWVNNGFMYLVIWAVYLLASFFSTFALSLIYNDAPDEVSESNIFPFWAPFLLVHLGGPHTITALAMEDNNLWHRHLLTQVVQICSVSVVFYQYKIFQSEWLLPTAIVFVIGIVKCVERIISLQLASFNFVRKSIRRQDSKKPPPPPPAAGVLDDYETVTWGYEFYQTFKGFIIDHTFTQDECGREKEWFSKLSVENAFKVMETELNFMYQAMFTKMIAVQYWDNNYFWCLWRFVCDGLLITVAVIFFCHSKHNLKPTDIGITYCLLGGQVVLDEIALLHLIFSHWTIVKIMNTKEVVRNKILPLINVGLKVVTVDKCWSEKIIQYSLVKHSLAGRLKCAEPKLEFYSLKDVIDSCVFTKTAKVGRRLKELVVEDIKRKAEAETNNNNNNSQDVGNQTIMDIMRRHTSEFATCVLILHVATEICYFTAATEESQSDDAKSCMEISQYLAHLLVLEGKITAALPGSIGMRFKDICWEHVRDTFDQLYDTFHQPDSGIPCWKRTRRQIACEDLLNGKYIRCNEEELENNNHKKYEKSVLPEAVELASAIMSRQYADPEPGNNTQQQRQEFWKVLSEVWVELLVYASAHCRGDIYYLNKGGQFYTFVRLLMAHFGLEKSLKADRPF
ncbi:PREDICTED: uncharacterized protein LOC109169293 [Ipomoea nil]|uniref:uncharacterized protein LOC109169293 n=1 Tax=Ipomoea nil TaxID=35883 RepID=UPI000901A8F0|nr:PREDICTED: uncharacterized protein LOC109169293 [Ipomoea nil]